MSVLRGELYENPLAQKSILKPEDLAQSNFIGISPWQLPSYTEIHKELFMNGNPSTASDVFLCDEYYYELPGGLWTLPAVAL